MRTVVAQVEHALGDAAGNPLLFTMGLTLLAEGISFTNRATLYDGFIERLAARSGATGIVAVTAALGTVYARLLDQGRRYADPYEWAQLLADAASGLETVGLSADSRAIDAAARRCGLITPIGYTQTLAPIHDSFADYLAGNAHARGSASFPTWLQPGDDQRVLFAAEIAGVDAALAALVARDQPFLTVRLARFDHRDLTEDAPAEVETLLRHLITGRGAYPVALRRTAGGRVIAVHHNQDRSAWVDESIAQRLREAAPAVIVEDGGPLAIAVRLWRQELLARLRTPSALGIRRPTSQEEARSALAAHASQTAAATARLIDAVAPTGHASVLTARVGPVGLTAIVHPAIQGLGGIQWPVSYRRTEDMSVVTTAVLEEEDAAGARAMQGWGRSSVDVLVRETPAAAAAKQVRDAINRLTVQGWL